MHKQYIPLQSFLCRLVVNFPFLLLGQWCTKSDRTEINTENNKKTFRLTFIYHKLPINVRIVLLRLMQLIRHNLPVVFYKHREHQRQMQPVPILAVKKNRWWLNKSSVNYRLYICFPSWSKANETSVEDKTRYS